ncbi:STAS domain-containing protein [Streptomyces sp. BBFR51]|uniref:STAS domain-containing protein n=1 Tax=Streptomyces sp. BBFR51 TaxID=3372856 RepID=UPI0037DC5E2F
MPPAQLNVHREDRGTRALTTFVGEIDLTTASLARTVLDRCLHDGIRTVDVDLTAVTFCDVSGLNVFLTISELARSTGATLRLHRPPQSLKRVIEVTGAGFLLDSPRPDRTPSRETVPAATP